AEPRDQLSDRVRRGAQQPAPGRFLDAPAYSRRERQLLGQRRLRLLFPAQLELPTCQYASARRTILSTDATTLVVRRGTPRVTAWSPGGIPCPCINGPVGVGKLIFGRCGKMGGHMTGVWRAATKLGVVIAITLLAAGLQELRAQQRAQSASQAGSESCARASFRVVVDVGHTVDVPGAMSARGIPEYAFNLQLAREIKQALVDAGFEQSVLLITTTAPRRGLVERAA